MSHGPPPPATEPASNRRSSRPRVWSTGLAVAAISGPALAVGGVLPEVTVGFSLVMVGLWHRLCRRGQPLPVPWLALVFVFAAVLTLVQWLPLPGIRASVAPELARQVERALAGSLATAWPGLTVVPGDTALEVTRLAGLAALCVAGAVLRWRFVMTTIAATGTAVACVGLVQSALDVERILGVYQPRDAALSESSALVGTFVNPNHQAGFLVLGITCAVGIAVAELDRANRGRDVGEADRLRDRAVASLVGAAIQIPAMVLCLSRGAIVALILVAPALVWFAVRGARVGLRRRGRRQGLAGRWLLALAMLGGFALVVRHGAWKELSSLGSLDAHGETKLRVARDSLALVSQPSWLGIGRGGFIDLFGQLDTAPSHVVMTHLESAPLAAVVEWGLAAGSLIVGAVVVWMGTAFFKLRTAHQADARLIAWLGLAAIGLHNLVDFGFEFLGLAAPAAALAGSLLPTSHHRLLAAKRARWGLVVLAVATALSLWATPRTWFHRHARDRAVAEGLISGPGELAWRPLDGRLHVVLARMASERGDTQAALERAEVATWLRPGSIDAWLLRSAAELALGRPQAARKSLAQALEHIHAKPSPELAAYLVARCPQPAALARLTPADPTAWKLLVVGLIDVAPEHADAVAAARAHTHADEHLPLQLRSTIAVRLGRPGLALHYARLAVTRAPASIDAQLAVVRALRSFSRPREAEVVDRLHRALETAAIDDPHELGRLEHELTRALVNLGDTASLDEAAQRIPTLLSRPAPPALRRQRNALAAEFEQRRRPR